MTRNIRARVESNSMKISTFFGQPKESQRSNEANFIILTLCLDTCPVLGCLDKGLKYWLMLMYTENIAAESIGEVFEVHDV